MTRRSSSGDPHRQAVYDAENDALPNGGRRFRRFVELEAFMTTIILGPWWEKEFPGVPLEVQVMRRSRGATFSAACVDIEGDAAAIWIRDGSWDLVTVIHELAHVACALSPSATGPHGESFTTALLVLWREHLGVHAYGALRSGFDDRDVPYRRDRLD